MNRTVWCFVGMLVALAAPDARAGGAETRFVVAGADQTVRVDLFAFEKLRCGDKATASDLCRRSVECTAGQAWAEEYLDAGGNPRHGAFLVGALLNLHIVNVVADLNLEFATLDPARLGRFAEEFNRRTIVLVLAGQQAASWPVQHPGSEDFTCEGAKELLDLLWVNPGFSGVVDAWNAAD